MSPIRERRRTDESVSALAAAAHLLDFAEPWTASEWLYKGSLALARFWRADEHCFLRATGPTLVGGGTPTPGLSHETGATSSNRAFLTTTELLVHLCEEGLWDPTVTEDRLDASDHDRWQAVGELLATMWHEMALHYFQHEIDDLRAHSDNGVNDFTDAQVMISLSILESGFARNYLEFDGPDRRPEIQAFADVVEQKISEVGGAKLADTGAAHPLLTLHSVRALEVARHVTGLPDDRSRVSEALEASLRRASRDDLLKQLGLHAAEDAEFDPAALLGNVALQHRFAGMSGRRLVEKGVDLLGTTQGFDGSWKTQILTGAQKLVYLPSLELSVSLANLALADLSEGSTSLATATAPILNRSLLFLEAGYREAQSEDGSPSAGWMNDQARQPEVVESWSTALASQLLLRLKRIARRLEQHTIREKYRTTQPRRVRREWLRWPDLSGAIPLVRSVDVEKARATRELKRLSDPSRSGVVKHALETDLVHTTIDDPFNRPPSTRSFVLYGPPGTRKSSMVGAVAAALDWPLVTLAPPDFLRDGISGLEARADEIFTDLLLLRRVVIFFDECEELFRRRMISNSPEHRVQSDFITSGMLPRLQELHDQRWVVFAIATNTELDELDPAVVRFGRIDAQQRIGHPELDAQLRYLDSKEDLDPGLRTLIEAELREFDRYLEERHEPVTRASLREERRRSSTIYRHDGHLHAYFDKVERVRAREAELPLVTFGVLDELVRRLQREDVELSAERVRAELSTLAESKGRPRQWTDLYDGMVPVTVDAEEYLTELVVGDDDEEFQAKTTGTGPEDGAERAEDPRVDPRLNE